MKEFLDTFMLNSVMKKRVQNILNLYSSMIDCAQDCICR